MTDANADPYHAGERLVQEQTGERDAAVLNGGVIADAVPPGALGFVAAQDMVVVGRADAQGAVWATIVAGMPGFATVDDDRRTLWLASGPAPAMARGAPLDALAEGELLGLLFIELATRRRLRVNGRLASVEGTALTLAVEEAYPNCPKYIQRRVKTAGGATATCEGRRGTALTPELVAHIAAADTFFVASRGPNGRLDASHRGGPPGFVRVADGALLIPDYPGNSMFNTFGNLTLDPRAGLVFPLFGSDRQLALTGTAGLHLDGEHPPPTGSMGRTGRWWSFTPQSWTLLPLGRAFAWAEPEPSPFNPPEHAS